MIRIARQYDLKGVPAGFRGHGRVKKQRLLLDQLHAGVAPQDLPFKSTVWKPAKVALKRETGGKCAYCEAPAAGRSRPAVAGHPGKPVKGGLVAHCDVEHFRPKDLYWWLAHNFENYLHSCQVCNQSFKINQFPATAPLTSPVAVAGNETETQLDTLADVMAPDPLDVAARGAWEKILAQEDADLADPLRENPAALFKYSADVLLGEVSILPKPASGRQRARAESTIAVLGLDREELRFARYDVYSTLHTLHLVLTDPGAAGLTKATKQCVVDELARLMAGNKPFAGMARHFVNDEWGHAITPA